MLFWLLAQQVLNLKMDYEQTRDFLFESTVIIRSNVFSLLEPNIDILPHTRAKYLMLAKWGPYLQNLIFPRKHFYGKLKKNIYD